MVWEAVKVEYEGMLEKWELGGRCGMKPVHLKQREVYSMLGLDTEDVQNSAQSP